MLKAVLESLEGLPEDVATHYVEGEDKKFRLDIEGGFKTTEEISGLSTALGKERARADAAEKRLKSFDGFDPKEFQKQQVELEQLRASRDDAAKERDAFVADALKPVAADRDQYKALYEQERAEKEAMAIEHLIAQSKVFDKVKDPIYRRDLQNRIRPLLKYQDGNVVGFNAMGGQIFDSNGMPAPKDLLVEMIAKSFPDSASYFEGSTASGSGATPSANMSGGAGGIKTMKRADFEKLDPASRMARMKEGYKITD